jgi:hypothetical protein
VQAALIAVKVIKNCQGPPGLFEDVKGLSGSELHHRRGRLFARQCSQSTSFTEEIVTRLNVMAVMLAALMLPLEAAERGNVIGEKLDSGLGALPATYTGAEYMPAGWVRGESMDSGLGELPATYTAAEFLPRRIAAAQR